MLIATGALAICAPLITSPGSAQENAGAEDAAIAELDAKIATVNVAGRANSPNVLELAEEAEAFALSLKTSPRQTERLVTTIRLQARALFGRLEYDEALKHINRAKKYSLEPNSIVHGELLLTEGQVFGVLGDYGAAIKNFNSALTLFELAGRRELQASALQALGIIYYNAGQYPRALSFYQRMAVIIEEDDKYRRWHAVHNIALTLANFDRLEEAEEAYKNALALARETGRRDAEQLTLSNFAQLELRRGRFQAAEEHLTAAFSIAEEYPVERFLIAAKFVSADLNLQTGNLEKSREIVEELFDGQDLSSTPGDYKYPHETAYQLYGQLGDEKLALAHLKAFKRLDDLGDQLAMDASKAIVDAEFEFAQKELEISQLRTDQLESDAALTGASRRQTRTVIIGLAVLALGVIGFAFWRYWSMRRTQRITQILNSELAASNVELEKANQAKMEFLAATSHEVRTPLNAIISLTEIILKADEFTNNDRDYLEVVNSSGKNLLHILDDILDVSKLEAGRMKVKLRPLDIAECVLDVAGLWRNAAREKGLNYTIDVDDGLGEYMCDERLIRQIVSNLLSNAIKFTAEGDVGIVLKPADNGFAITVRDTGIGVAGDQQAIIFETFRQAEGGDQRAYGGTGLGLAICRKIAEELGGDISVASEPGKGAKFDVKILADKCKTADGDAAIETGQGKGDTAPEQDNEKELSVIRVLVAEDNPANALVISAMLSGQVAQIVVVENGAEAVKAIQEQSFDVILMDKQMPVMDGVVATQKIRALPTPYCNIPIIGLTAHILSDSREECLESGMDDYLTKPVPSSKLKAAMIEAIKARRAVAGSGGQ